MNSYVPLNLFSQYSISLGIADVDALVKKAKLYELPALALTDRANLFAAIKFYTAARKEGLKPIIGSVIPVSYGMHCGEMIILAKNYTGYIQLMECVTALYQEGVRVGDVVALPYTTILSLKEVLIISSGAQGLLQVVRTHYESKFKELLIECAQSFKDAFYIGITRLGSGEEAALNEVMVAEARQYQIPLLAVHPTYFIEKEDCDAHEARIAIQESTTLEARQASTKALTENYFKSPRTIIELFADLPDALANTVAVAKRCNLIIPLGKVFLPTPPMPEGQTAEAYLSTYAKEALERRIAIFLKGVDKQTYFSRLESELGVINQMGFAGYFLIVADFIAWAKKNHIPVGPGRGSGAGSLVAYALEITDVDPLQYDLLFERFLNPERVSMPDFDIDFCMEGRDRVIEYVTERYGRNNVAQIATFGTMAAKAVVRDCGRVLGLPYGFVDKIAKLIPFELGMTLQKALVDEPLLKARRETEEEVEALITLALKLEGVVRNVGKHAGGVVIAPSKLTDFTPLYCEEGSQQMVVQYDKDDIEAVGLLKFDFLGLKTLTVIDWAVRSVNAARISQNLSPIDIRTIPLNDAKTFDLLKRCQTTAIFQLESRGMKDLIKRLKPDTFEDIIALVALFRPGPLQSGMVDDFINRKHGKSAVNYSHPDLQPILRPTYGVILYQEQVMQIAQVLAGYTLGSADLLRRAMGKKKPEEMALQRTIFLQGAQLKGISTEVATNIFDLMEKFAGYGFNKSHSAAYAFVSYQTAWLKAHYASAFMAATLSSEISNTDKIVVLLREARDMGITVLPPSYEKSEYYFTVQAGAICYGLGAIKGVGEQAVNAILETRGEHVKTFSDILTAIDIKKINKRVFENLIKAGVFDNFNGNRAQLLFEAREVLQGLERQKISEKTQMTLFEDPLPVQYATQPALSLLEKLSFEKETLGLYLSGHPIHFFAPIVSKLMKRGKEETILAMVQAIRTLFTRKGDKMAILTLEDGKDLYEATVFSDVYEKSREHLTSGSIVVCIATREHDKFSDKERLRVLRIHTLPAFIAEYAKKLVLYIKNEATPDALKSLYSTCQAQETPVLPLEFVLQNASHAVRVSAANQLASTDLDFIETVAASSGVLKAEFV